MLRSLLASCLVVVCSTVVSAHCQVPCGIYGDQLRFEQMLEDEQTIAKAQNSVAEITSGSVDSQAVNQMVRWTTAKEEHASRIQETIASYFMAQRIKPDAPDYTKKLTAAHKVMVAAMNCKQSVDPATAKAITS